jgi:hypothetical protein
MEFEKHMILNFALNLLYWLIFWNTHVLYVFKNDFHIYNIPEVVIVTFLYKTPCYWITLTVHYSYMRTCSCSSQLSSWAFNLKNSIMRL